MVGAEGRGSGTGGQGSGTGAGAESPGRNWVRSAGRVSSFSLFGLDVGWERRIGLVPQLFPHGFEALELLDGAAVLAFGLGLVAQLREDLATLYQPVNSQELFALERVTLAQQTVLRPARLEAGYCSTSRSCL